MKEISNIISPSPKASSHICNNCAGFLDEGETGRAALEQSASSRSSSVDAFVHAMGSKMGGKHPELTTMGASSSAGASIELLSQIDTLTANE